MPSDPALTAYDERHAITYMRLLDADAGRGRLDWEVARIVLHIDPDRELYCEAILPALLRQEDGSVRNSRTIPSLSPIANASCLFRNEMALEIDDKRARADGKAPSFVSHTSAYRSGLTHTRDNRLCIESQKKKLARGGGHSGSIAGAGSFFGMARLPGLPFNNRR